VGAGAALAVIVAGSGVGLWWWSATRSARLRAQAVAASRAGDRVAALDAWHALNAAGSARAADLLAEARAALTLGRAAEADRALDRAVAADPTDPDPWRLKLERLRVQDQPVKAQAVGRAAYAAVPAGRRRGVLRDWTLALLADLPEDLARRTLARWAGADPSRPDREARVALLRRIAAAPRDGDPDRASRIAELSALLAADPGLTVAREALVSDLADAGEPDLGRNALDAWPEPDRDARYWRLRGRWDLDYDRRPGPAAEAFGRALADLPHDWKTRVRLARALHALGRPADARREAESVARTREALDPATLGPVLSAALDPDRPADPQALTALADLSARAGLHQLADAWRREAAGR
jgi:thioredoxin-like negative regulator of GroEL